MHNILGIRSRFDRFRSHRHRFAVQRHPLHWLFKALEAKQTRQFFREEFGSRRRRRRRARNAKLRERRVLFGRLRQSDRHLDILVELIRHGHTFTIHI